MFALRTFKPLLSGVLLVAAASMFSSCSTRNRDAAMFDEILKEAKEKFAPDRRTAVFDVKAEPHGQTVVLKGEVHSLQMKSDLLALLRERTPATFEDSIVALPDPRLGDRTSGIVSLSVANIRVKPDHGAEMGTQAILGTPLQILKKRRGWDYVQTPEGYLGWTDDHVVVTTADEAAAWSAKPKLLVTTIIGFTRERPDRSSQVVSDVVAGSILGLKGESAGFYEVEYPDGRTAFLPRDMAKPYAEWLKDAHDTPESVVSTAKRFMGLPYLWGGTSAKGMDCSGFTKTVYFLNGVLLPRDASQQVRVGELVDTTGGIDLKPGDLLFFGSRETPERRERVTHVAISLGGKRFIHSSTDVHINSLAPSDTDYSKHRDQGFLRAKRIIGAGVPAGVNRLRDLPYYGLSHE
jgi:cell wall-associated NlpC family hydrolase